MDFIFRQLFEKESSTYTYIVGDPSTKEAFIIDPVIETMDRDLSLIDEMGLKLKYVVETHIHADHITSSGKIREKTGAKIVVGKATNLETADLLLGDGDEFQIGSHSVKVIQTPGHTDGCTSFQVGPWVFTGDALMIRGCGRTDFQQGSNETLFQSVREKLFALPGETLVCPGHDYKGRTMSSIGEEKKHNPRLKLSNSLDQFCQIMDGLNLAHPNKIDMAVPANLKSGLV